MHFSTKFCAIEYIFLMKEYNRSKAVEYAEKWALSANPKFYHFGGIGGDCTNFISQCLLAGGGKMNYSQHGWFYVSSSNRSASWTSVQYLQQFLLSNKGAGPFAKQEKIENLQVGDLIQLRQNPTHFNHTVIITHKARGEIFVCAHSNDALNKRLSEYAYEELLGLHIIGIRE